MAISIVAGDPLHTFLTHLNTDQTPILGEVFEVVFAEKSDGTPFDVAITEDGDGRYMVDGTTSVTDPDGEWLLEVRAQSDGRRYQQVFDVSIGRAPIVIAQAATTSGHTRQTIRRQIARDLGDFLLVTATATGTQSSVISEDDLSLEYGHFVAMQVVPVEGTEANLYQTATVTVSSQQQRSIAFVPPFPADTQPGDVFEMYNHRGTGWKMEEYNAAINAAIVRAGEEHHTLPYAATISGYFNRQSPYIAIPPEFSHIYGVEIVGSNGIRKTVQPVGISYSPATREIALSGHWATKAHGKQVRLLGKQSPGTLETDDARTSVGIEWLVHEASAMLLQKDTAQGFTQGDRTRLFYLERQGADGRRPSIVTSYPPNSIKL